MNPELSLKYRAELSRLDAEYAHYERQWSKLPQFAWVVLSVPLAAFVWGFGAAVVALLVTVALVATRAYLIAMRKGEIRWMRARLLDDMGEGEESAFVRDDAQPSYGSAESLRASFVAAVPGDTRPY